LTELPSKQQALRDYQCCNSPGALSNSTEAPCPPVLTLY
jgi:hypothetical protein